MAIFSCSSSVFQIRALTGASLEDCLVISADTVVSVNNMILGKPADKTEALSFLRMLNNRSHTVITACSLFYDGLETSFSVVSQVRFANNSEKLLKAYAHTGEGLDKAGAYAVQGRGATLISGVEGSWTNIVGLPVAELMQTLLEKGLVSIGPLP